jgi:hypothetical protein
MSRFWVQPGLHSGILSQKKSSEKLNYLPLGEALMEKNTTLKLNTIWSIILKKIFKFFTSYKKYMRGREGRGEKKEILSMKIWKIGHSNDANEIEINLRLSLSNKNTGTL